ncbi:sprouty-related, EVH1 domain-containing protein 3 isoform X2 [Polypterus senegalus]|uniref:sprouty-related, EVH1 domain-containing protein 3 isoform X2 n=1 Tax=Polypterus senegalus TaxID=55291 RepID=UPI0019667DC8|nr:sprouty-related, EVH1 domain-containing protein 3 isoform X2 [Polypterus senegalus]
MEEDFTVRVRAVVMTRDDSSGGWVPMGGGGLSHVTICKGKGHEESSQQDYLIRGERLRDQAPILECNVKRDLVYNKVNPIFHHWKVDERKFGLTFQSPADAVSFERGVQSAIEELEDGSESSSTNPDENEGADETRGIRPLQRQGVIGSALSYHDEEELESINPCKDLWVTKGYEDYRRAAVQQKGQKPISSTQDPDKIDLCVVQFEKGSSESASTKGKHGTSGLPSHTTTSHHLHHHHHCPSTGLEAGLKDPKMGSSSRGSGSPSHCRIHGGAISGSVGCRTKGSRVGGSVIAGEEESSISGGPPSRCVYCRDVFSDEENGRGQCQDAPDPMQHCIHQLSCMWCAESMLYHCMSDSEGEFSDPCSCEDTTHPHFCARWLALVALSLLVPCMCCYLPLRACLRCGEKCGCCGGKHKAVR